MVVRTRNRVAERTAFSLMEMLVVVAIILLLAAAVVPVYLSYLEDARIDRTRADVKAIETALDVYYTRNGDYPADWKSALFMPDPTTGRAALPPEAQYDPWQQEYGVDYNQRHPTTQRPLVFSPGPPGRGAPITNW